MSDTIVQSENVFNTPSAEKDEEKHGFKPKKIPVPCPANRAKVAQEMVNTEGSKMQVDALATGSDASKEDGEEEKEKENEADGNVQDGPRGDGNMSKKRKGKKKAQKAKSNKKGKGKKREADDDVDMDDGGDDDDGMDEDYRPAKGSKGEPKVMEAKMEKETAKHSDEEEKVDAAQFSVNVINLFNAPMEIHFGNWNTRPLVALEWKKLKASMTAQGIKSFSNEHMMPLVIKRRHVDPSCVDNNVSGYAAKTLALSEEGKQEVKRLEMAGGRHRLAAVKSIKQDKEQDVAKLKKQHQILSKKRAVKDDAVTKKLQNLKDYEEKIAKLEEEISKIGLWGVIVYDEDKLKEDERLLPYLSMNLAVQRYAQTDGEALLHAIHTYLKLLKDGNQQAADAYVVKCQGKGQPLLNVNYSMPNTEGREFAMKLYKLQCYMGHTTAFNSKWIKDHLIGVYGGILCEITEYLVNIMISLFTPTKVFTMDNDDMFHKYQEQNETDGEMTMDAGMKNNMEACWKWMASKEALEKPGRQEPLVEEMLTTEIADGLDELLGSVTNHLMVLGRGDQRDDRWDDGFD
ncbi:hypothetical protein F5887DRAFT_1086906 [Amanita rubescens]|nr:hypothetical protein F5887DRAFT_1086906 [Amanita rubescens]